METRWQKQGSNLVPFDLETTEWLEEQSDGKYFNGDIGNPRNARYHAKFFKLLSVVFPYWHPPAIEGVIKDKENFRKKLIIRAGFHKQVFNLDGTFELVPESISFAAMPDDEAFNRVYNKVVDVILKDVLVGWTIQEVDELVGGFL